MTFTEASQLTTEQIARHFHVPLDLLQGAPRAAAPRTWSLCMTSENHGTVGKAGDPFSHAPGKHERVQVVEIVAAGTPPAPDVDLAGLVRIDVADLIGKLDEVRTWACNLPIPTRGAGSAMRKVSEVKEALAAAPPTAQAGQVVAQEVWISIDETEPPEHELIALRYWPYGNSENPQAVTGGRYIDGTYYNDEGDEMHPPSHWCRLPYFDAGATAKASTSGERQEGGAA